MSLVYVVRGLWGDEEHVRHGQKPPAAYFGIRREMLLAAELGEWVDLVLCWGEKNYNFSRSLGFESIKVSDTPYASPRRKKERGPQYGGMCLWGVNHAWHKLSGMVFLLLQGIAESLLWVDWDIRQNMNLDLDRWLDDISDTSLPFCAKLVRQKNTKWAASWRENVPIDDKRLVPYTGVFFARESEFMVRSALWMNRCPIWMSQQCVAKEMDECYGWGGAYQYRDLGFELDGVYIPNQIYESHEYIWAVDSSSRQHDRKMV